nr:PIN domain-containing protein [Sulfolobus islandicus]
MIELRLVMDSYAWIEFFLGSDKGKKVFEILSSADEILTPDLVLAEIGRKYIREGIDEKAVIERLKFMEENSVILCINSELSVEGAMAYIELLSKAKSEGKSKPSLTDSVFLAISRKYTAKIVTRDEIFKGMNEVIFI